MYVRFLLNKYLYFFLGLYCFLSLFEVFVYIYAPCLGADIILLSIVLVLVYFFHLPSLFCFILYLLSFIFSFPFLPSSILSLSVIFLVYLFLKFPALFFRKFVHPLSLRSHLPSDSPFYFHSQYSRFFHLCIYSPS